MKLVIFDCDGTLVDSQHMIVAAMRQAYAALGLVAPGRERLLSIVGLSLEQAFLDLGGGDVNFPVRDMVEQYKIAFSALRRSSAAHEPLFPGAREAIERLSARDDVLLGVATGKSRRGVAIVLGRHGLLDRFATIQTADDAPSKPHPGMAMAAMREAGVAPADTIVVGDTTFDMGMAGAAGATGVGVAWGYHPPSALRDAGAHAVVADFTALLPALDLVWSDRERGRHGAAAP